MLHFKLCQQLCIYFFFSSLSSPIESAENEGKNRINIEMAEGISYKSCTFCLYVLFICNKTEKTKKDKKRKIPQ